MGILDVLKALKKNHEVIAVLPEASHEEKMIDIVKRLAKPGIRICYVTMKRTYSAMKELLEKNEIDTSEFLWIDAISEMMRDFPDEPRECYLVSSPADFSELSYAIITTLRSPFFPKEGYDYIIFDDVNDLLVYKDEYAVKKLMSKLSQKIRENNTKVVFLALDIKEHENLIKELGKIGMKIVNIK